MNLQLELDENTILHYVESTQEDYNEEKQEDVILAYQLSFSFYHCDYFVDVKRESITEDFPFVLVEGDSNLHASFEERCEGELWPLIKQKCNEFDIWYKQLGESLENKEE